MTPTVARPRPDLRSLRAADIPESSTVAIADLAAKLRREGASVVDFSAGRAAEATAEAICDAAHEALQRGDTHQTEARGRPDYLEACADKLCRDNGIDLDPARELIATLGCKQGLVLALLNLINPGDEVIIEDPCFVSYAPTIRLLGGVPVPVPLRPERGFRWCADDLAAAIGQRTRVILFCSPHNPTGIVHQREDLQVIADAAIRNDLAVVADEIYESVTWNGRQHLPIATLPAMAERTVGLMGLTKTYSMGGWRIGYAYGPQTLIGSMVKSQQHLMTCASSFSQAGAQRALEPEVTRSMHTLWQDWERRCAYVTEALNGLPGLEVMMPEGAFYAWIDIRETGLGSHELAHRLLSERQVAAVPGGAFGSRSDGYLRVTCVRGWPELRDGVARIKAFLEDL
ncbi:MAG: pyridoxal phosphate-dependent aminotransferase [Acidobacteriota bacterium]